MILREKLQKRAELVNQARSVLDTAEAAKRSMNSEENARYEAITSDVDLLNQDISSLEKQLQMERSIAENVENTVERTGSHSNSEEAKQVILGEALRSYMTTGQIDNAHFEEWRSLQSTSDTEGGYLVMPELFVTNLIKFIDDEVYIRQLATKFQVPNSNSLGAVSLDTDVSDADWSTELSTGSEDTSMAFGKRSLSPHAFAKQIKISNTLLRRASNTEQLVLARLGYKAGVTEEKAYLLGTGSNQPLGIMTASAQGISTARDVSTDNTTTAITLDGLKNALYSLKSGYRGKANWMFHRDAIKQIAKIKDSDGRYIWQPSTIVGQAATIDGVPVVDSEFMPNTFTTGQYVGVIGDFSHYWIADAMDLQIKRLNELHALTDQTGFVLRKESDGMPVLEEAFARVTLA